MKFPEKKSAGSSSRKKSARKGSEEKYRTLFDSVDDAIFILDLEGNFLDVNKAASARLGHAKEELLSMHVSRLHSPAFAGAITDKLAQVRAQGHGTIVSEHVTKDGAIMPVEISARIIDYDGRKAIFSIIRDISKRKQAEEEKNRSEKRFHALFDNTPLGTVIVDLDRRIVDCNAAFQKMLGYSLAELKTMTVPELSNAEDDLATRAHYLAMINGDIDSFTTEKRYIRKDGAVLWTNLTGTVIRDDQGKPQHFFGIVEDITERKRAEQALLISESRLKDAQQIATIGNWEWDITTNKVFWSDELFRIYGYRPQEISPDHGLIVDAMHPDSRKDFLEAIDVALKGQRPFEMDYTFLRQDGSASILHTRGEVLRDTAGKPVRMVGIVQDISERKRAEESVLLFRNLLNQSNDAIFVNDPATGRFLIVNDKACSNLGYDRNTLLTLRTLDIEELFPDQATWDAHVAEVRRNGYLVLEGMNKRHDGTLFPVEVNVTHMTSGGKDYMVAVVRDISERKLTEQALRVSEERLSKAQRMAHVGNWEWNLAANQLYWSEEVYRIYGVDPATFVPVFDAVGKAMHPDDREPFLNAVNAALYERKHFEMDYRLLRPDGTERTVHTIGEVTYDNAGKPLVKSGTVQDVTEQKQAEDKLRQSEEFVRNILNAVDEGFIVIDRDFRILTANKAYCSQAGRTSDEVIGRHCYEISHGRLRPCYQEREDCAVRHVFETGRPHTTLHRHKDAKGSILYVETKAFPILVSSGTVTSVIETVNNITEKHLLEEERLKTQKLEAIGTLAGGIAHDFNNLLQGVFGYISMAKIKLDQKEGALAMLEQAEKALHMSVSLAKQLLTFSKGGKPLKRKIDLRPVIDNAVKFALSGSSVDYRITFDEDLRAVGADEGQIGQVIQNVVLNADQAMPLGGMVAIRVKNVRAPHPGLPPVLTKGDYVEIAVQDSGIGIPEQYLQKIYDPYFTTKEKGSGLGLATSYSIIRNHGGAINVASEVGKGTTFSVYLPAVEAEAKSVEVPAVSPCTRKARILVMDDEDLIRHIVGEMIRAAGHEAEFAEHGGSAVEKYRAARESGNPFDIVILDLTIRGGLGGKETIKQLLEIDPGVKAIVSSGYSNDTVVADHHTYGFAARLMKPYEYEELRDTLNAVLISRSPL